MTAATQAKAIKLAATEAHRANVFLRIVAKIRLFKIKNLPALISPNQTFANA